MVDKTTSATRPTAARRKPDKRPTGRSPVGRPPSRGWVWAAIAAVGVIGVLFVVFRSSQSRAGHTSYQVGSPGVGQAAPGMSLPASTGRQISLQSLHGKTVLLYFQEGVGCEPCWKQIKDLEASSAAVRAAGNEKVISITTQPVNLLRQKARDEAITTPILADTRLAVSKAYQANRYGMMGDSMDGHSFILVGPDGTIRWRADYGGPPKYTMYVPVKQLLADLKAGRRA